MGHTPHGERGLNSYTDWFKGDAQMEGKYAGYDGPWPPFNDERVHRYVFTLYALDVESLKLSPGFTGPDVTKAIEGHILAESSLTGTTPSTPPPAKRPLPQRPTPTHVDASANVNASLTLISSLSLVAVDMGSAALR